MGDEAEITRMYENQQKYLENPTADTSRAFMADMFHYMKHTDTHLSPAAQAELDESCELGSLFEQQATSGEAGGNEELEVDNMLNQVEDVVTSTNIAEENEGTHTIDAVVAHDKGNNSYQSGGGREEEEDDEGLDNEELEDEADSKARKQRREKYENL